MRSLPSSSQTEYLNLPPTTAAPVRPISALQLLQRKRKLRQRIPPLPLLLSPSSTTDCIRQLTTPASIGYSDIVGSNITTLPINVERENNRSVNSSIEDDQYYLWNMNSIGGGIIEISGEAGSGKTQLCLGMCVSCASSYMVKLSPSSSSVKKFKTNGTASACSNPPPTFQQPNPATIVNVGYKTQNIANNVHNNDVLRKQQQNPQQKHERKKIYQKAIYVTMGENSKETTIANRLEQIATSRHYGCNKGPQTNKIHSSQFVRDLLHRIITKSIRNVDDFHDLIFCDLPRLLSDSNAVIGSSPRVSGQCSSYRERIGVVIIDSIGGMFRRSFDDSTGGSSNDDTMTQINSNYYMDRSGVLFSTASQLKKISDLYTIPIIVVNQVTATLNGVSLSLPRKVLSQADFIENANHTYSKKRTFLTPALGLGWSNCVNTRYYVTRSEIIGTALTEKNKSLQRLKPTAKQHNYQQKHHTYNTNNSFLEQRKEDDVLQSSKICFQRNIYLTCSAESKPIMAEFIINSKGACKC